MQNFSTSFVNSDTCSASEASGGSIGAISRGSVICLFVGKYADFTFLLLSESCLDLPRLSVHSSRTEPLHGRKPLMLWGSQWLDCFPAMTVADDDVGGCGADGGPARLRAIRDPPESLGTASGSAWPCEAAPGAAVQCTGPALDSCQPIAAFWCSQRQPVAINSVRS